MRVKKQLNGLPDNQILWVTRTEEKKVYYITSNTERSMYFLYTKDNGNIVQIAKSTSPLAFEKYYKD